MRILKTTGSWALSLLTLAGFGWLIVSFVRWFTELLGSIDPETAAAIVTGAVAVFVATGGVYVAKIFETRATIRQDNRSKKIPVYEEIVNFITKIFAGERFPEHKLSEDELAQLHLQLMEKIVVWGSDRVLKAYADVRRASLSGSSLAEMATRLEALYLAIRQDLGHSNQTLTQGDILIFFFNDVQEILSATDQRIGRRIEG